MYLSSHPRPRPDLRTFPTTTIFLTRSYPRILHLNRPRLSFNGVFEGAIGRYHQREAGFTNTLATLPAPLGQKMSRLESLAPELRDMIIDQCHPQALVNLITASPIYLRNFNARRSSIIQRHAQAAHGAAERAEEQAEEVNSEVMASLIKTMIAKKVSTVR
ncbi:hypothetical protein F5Y05DRAFT_388593 [Hypoxylon sp. FL0543]|nr:hypothetical protein F5Y05DRAFT_388593 [Hypoxylon sp. FL0543]